MSALYPRTIAARHCTFGRAPYPELRVHYNNEPEGRAAYLEAGRRRDVGRLRPRRLRRAALGGQRHALGGDRSPRRPRPPGHVGRGGGLGGADPGPLPAGAGAGTCARTSPSSAASPACANAPAGWA